MNITIERAALLKAIERVRGIVETRNTIPILSNIKIEARGSELIVTATDLDRQATATAPLSDLGGTGGAVTVPAATLYDLIRKVPEGAQIVMAMGDDPRLQVKAGRSKFNLPILPADDFPEIPTDGLSDVVRIPAADIARIVDKAGFSMSSEEVRYYLQGVYLHVVQRGDARFLRGVATDGSRMALADVPLPAGLEDMSGVIIPRKTVREMKRMADAGGEVEFRVSSEKVWIGADGASLISKLIDGTFPDYVRVLPTNNENIMTVERGLLRDAVDRVATISTEKSRGVRFSLAPGRLVLTARNMDAGQAVEEVEVDYDGAEIDFGLNARYTLDVLAQIDGQKAEFRIDNALTPILVLDPTDENAQFVVMPLRM